MTFNSGKLLAGIGAIFLALSALFPFLLFLIGLDFMGLILLYLGLRQLAKHYNDPAICKSKVGRGVVFGIIGPLFALGILVNAALTNYGNIPLNLFSYFNTYPYTTGEAMAFLFFLTLFFLLEVTSFRSAFTKLGVNSGKHYFKIAGTLLLVGAALTFFFIGVLLLLVGWIILIAAFFSLKPAIAYQ